MRCDMFALESRSKNWVSYGPAAVTASAYTSACCWGLVAIMQVHLLLMQDAREAEASPQIRNGYMPVRMACIVLRLS